MSWFHEFEFSLDEMRKATILKYVGNQDEVAFPSHIVADEECYEVTGIGDNVFLEIRQNLKACWLPNGLNYISPCAFSNTIIEHLYVRKDTLSARALENTKYMFTPLSLSINKKEIELLLDEDERQVAYLISTISKEIGTAYEYIVEDEEVASCSKEGKVEAKKKGSTVIRLCSAGHPDFCDTCLVSVEEPSLSIYPSHLNINLRYGKEKRVAVVIGPEEFKYNEITYTSSNDKVATVDSTGRIMGKIPGCTMITATSMVGKAIISDTCSLLCGKLDTKDVLQILSKDTREFPICPDEVTLSLEKHEEYQLQVKEKHLQKRKKELTWSVGDEEVADVSPIGVVQAKGLGCTYVKAESDELLGWCKITVV